MSCRNILISISNLISCVKSRSNLNYLPRNSVLRTSHLDLFEPRRESVPAWSTLLKFWFGCKTNLSTKKLVVIMWIYKFLLRYFSGEVCLGVGGWEKGLGGWVVWWALGVRGGGGQLKPPTSDLRPQTSDLRPHSGDSHHIPEKSFFY